MNHQDGSLKSMIRCCVLFLPCMLFLCAGVCSAQSDSEAVEESQLLSNQLSQANEQLEQTRTELKTAINESERLSTELSNEKKELETVRGDLQKKTDELTQALSQIGSLQAKAAQLKNVSDELKATTYRVEALSVEKQTLEEQLAQARGQEDQTQNNLAMAQEKIQSLTREKQQLETSLTKTSQLRDQEAAQLAQTASQLDVTRKKINELQGQIQSVSHEKMNLETALATVNEEKAETQGQLALAQKKVSEVQGRIKSVSNEKMNLETALSAANKDKDQVQKRLNETMAEKETLAADLESARQLVATKKNQLAQMASLKSMLAPRDGGSANMETVGPRAKAAYDQFVTLYRNKKSSAADWKKQIKKTGLKLHDAQSLAGRILGAKGLVVVQPEQTLSTIAYQFYGKPNWARVYQANTHILDNPDLVVPGITLVIP